MNRNYFNRKTFFQLSGLMLIAITVVALLGFQHSKNQATANTQQNERPNIVWLIAEDISPFLSCYGDSTALTPNIDRLAREGVKFTQVYDVSGVCAPSRSALITGMYPTCIGTHNMRTPEHFPNLSFPPYSVVLPPEVKMFSELMRREGYYCTNNEKEDYQFNTPRSGWNESSKNAHWRNRQPGQPFFSIFTFMVTHESMIWLKKKDSLLVNPEKVPLPPYYPESPVIRKDVARMYSNIMEMDKQVGKLLQQLEQDGLLDNTIVIFFADNGGPLPRGKREVYNTGLKVPLIVRFPHKQYAGTTNNELVSFVDFAPTMLSLAQISIPSYMQGQAFLGTQKAKTPRQYIFAARDRMGPSYDMVRTVGDGRYKYFRNFQPEKPYIQYIPFRLQMELMKELLKFEKENKLNEVQKLWFRKTKPEEELYDTQNDPFELHNLADKPEYNEKKKELRAQLYQWMRQTTDKGFIPEKEWVEMLWPNMKQPVTEPPVFTVHKNKTVALSCPTAGASISYQLLSKNDSPQENKWQVYVHPIAVGKNEVLYAAADRIGYKGSNVQQYKP